MTEEQKKAKRKAYLRAYQKEYRAMHKEKHTQYMRYYRAGLLGVDLPKTEPLILPEEKKPVYDPKKQYCAAFDDKNYICIGCHENRECEFRGCHKGGNK